MAITQPVRRKWSREEYYQMADLGWFQGQRTELVGGEVVVLNPQRFSHYAAVEKVSEELKRFFGDAWWVRAQAPLTCSEWSEPEPDVSVVQGRREDYTEHPRSAALVVEVSDTTLGYDRGDKMSLYAQAGIPEYWIVNLADGQLEVHRDPVPDADRPFGHSYRDIRRLPETDRVSPLEKTGSVIEIGDLFP